MTVVRSVNGLLRRYRHVNRVLADQALLSGVNFLTGVLLARYLGIEEFGRFSLIWIGVLFVHSIQRALIISPMMSIGPKQPASELPGYYCAVTVQQCAYSLLSVAVMLVCVESLARFIPAWNIDGLALPLAAVAFATQWQEFLRRYFFARKRQATAFINDIVRYASQVAMLLLLFIYYESVARTEVVLWIIAGSACISFYGLFLMETLDWNLALYRETLRRHWQFSKWILASFVTKFATGRLGTILTGLLLGTAAVGALRVGHSLMGITHVFLLGLENLVPVRAAEHYQAGGRDALFGYLKRVAIFAGGMTAAVALVAGVAPEFWLGLIFGEEYREYGFVLRWFAVIYLVRFLVMPLSAGLGAMERTRYLFKARLVSTIYALVFTYPLIKFFGLTGLLAGQLLISLVFITILFNGLTKETD